MRPLWLVDISNYNTREVLSISDAVIIAFSKIKHYESIAIIIMLQAMSISETC